MTAKRHMQFARKLMFLIGDAIFLCFSLICALLLRYGFNGFNEAFLSHISPFSVIFPLWVLVFYLTDLYREQGLQNKVYLAKKIITGILISLLSSVVLFYLFPDFFGLTPKTNLVLIGLFFFIFDYVFRISAVRIFALGAIPVLFLGDSPLAQKTVEYLKENSHTGYKIEEWFRSINEISFDKIKKIVKEKNIGLIVTAPNVSNDFSILRAVYQSLQFRINSASSLNFYERLFEKAPLEELNESWFISNISLRRPFYEFIKRIIDIFLSVFILIIFSPVFLLSFFIIILTSRGQAIYKQERVGRNGINFILYKFRTMVNNSEGPLWTESKDKRLTTFGRFLRFTHLDELPQLFNIIKNDISFIGPRPERVELAEEYKKIPFYEIRHVVKPGLTGWAQISYKPSSSIEEAYEKLRYDVYYIKNRSLFLDFLIFLKTIRYLFISSLK